MVDIELDVEDDAATVRTKLENILLSSTVSVVEFISTGYGWRDILRLSKYKFVSLKS